MVNFYYLFAATKTALALWWDGTERNISITVIGEHYSEHPGRVGKDVILNPNNEDSFPRHVLLSFTNQSNLKMTGVALDHIIWSILTLLYAYTYITTTTNQIKNTHNQIMSSVETETALVKCGTSVGDFAMEFRRHWSPMGYDRAVELFERGFYDHTHFYRAIPKFLVQFGITYSTDQDLKHFGNTEIPDDPQLDPPIAFKEGIISYAGSGDNSRSSQLFIAYDENPNFGTNKWETPVGEVVEGMDHIRTLYSYGDMPPWGKGPAQGKIHAGRQYIEENFPLIDKFIECKVTRRDGDGKDIVAENEEEPGLDDDKEEWSAKAVKRDGLVRGGGGIKHKINKKVIKDAYHKIRTKVDKKSEETGHDLVSMGGIVLVIILAILVKLSLKRKLVDKDSWGIHHVHVDKHGSLDDTTSHLEKF